MPSAATRFRFAHLSDCHLGPLPKVSIRQLMGKRLTGWSNWHWGRNTKLNMHVQEAVLEDLKKERVDHIVCSGDICNLGLSAEWAGARNFLEELSKPEKVTFVPGNHDAYCPGSLEGLLEALGPYASKSFPFVQIRESVAFVGLSTAVPTPPLCASGELGFEQLRSLKTILEQLADKALIKVIVLHHPPLPSLGGWRRGLRDASELELLLKAFDIDLVLYGHNHYAYISFLDNQKNKIPLVGAPSAFMVSHQAKKIPGYHIISIQMRENKSWEIYAETKFWTEKGIISKTPLLLSSRFSEKIFGWPCK